jgi:hypothetical protein
VPVTVYRLLLIGLTVMANALLPVLQVYVWAPLTIKVAVPPEQMFGAFTCKLGLGFILRFSTALLVPQALEILKV